MSEQGLGNPASDLCCFLHTVVDSQSLRYFDSSAVFNPQSGANLLQVPQVMYSAVRVAVSARTHTRGRSEGADTRL